MSNPITNDVFDSRDLIEYRDELQEEILDFYTDWVENHNENCDEGQELEIPTSFDDIEFYDEEAFRETCMEEIVEYEGVRDFCDELENYSADFEHGETIIHEIYFRDYCEQFLKDCGYIHDDLPSLIEDNIDWDGIADDMEIDYTRVDYNGDDYLIR